MTPGSFKRIIFTLILALSAIGLAQNPTVTVSPNSSFELIGETIDFSLTFENNGGAVGYEPFIWFWVPGVGPSGEPGIDFTQTEVQFLGEPLNASVSKVSDNDIPVSDGRLGVFVQCEPAPAIKEYKPLDFYGNVGDQLVVVPLPLGSFTPGQTPATIDFQLKIKPGAEIEPHKIQYGGGFYYGNNPKRGTPIFSGVEPSVDLGPPCLAEAEFTSSPATITPQVARIHKAFSHSDYDGNETAIGSNFVRSYTIAVEIAEDELLKGDSGGFVTIIDSLPNDHVIVGNFEISGGHEFHQITATYDVAGTPTTQVITDLAGTDAPLGPYNNFELKFEISDEGLSTTSGTVEITFDFYIPLLDADGEHPVGGENGHTENIVSADPIWGRDGKNIPLSEAQGEQLYDKEVIKLWSNDDAATDHSHGIITIRKTARVAGDTSGKRVQDLTTIPGTEIDFRLEIEVSDTSAFEDLQIHEFLDDGLEFVTNDAGLVEATVTRYYGTLTGDLVSLAAPVLNSTLQQEISFDLSSVLDDGQLLGAAVREQHDLGLEGAPGTVIHIDYKALVLDEYREQDTNGEPIYVLQTDHFNNRVELEAQPLNPEDLQPKINGDDIPKRHDFADDSEVVLSVPSSEVSKRLTHLNGHEVDPVEGTPAIDLGDTVTYMIRVDLETGDAGQFTITDFLPEPIMEAMVIDFKDNVLSNDAPIVGEAHFSNIDGFDSTRLFSAIDLVPVGSPKKPTVTADPTTGPGADPNATNSITFDFGTFASKINEPIRLEFLFTVQVTDVAVDDKLQISNMLTQEEVGNSGDDSSNSVIAKAVLNRPMLRIQTGVVGIGNNTAATPNTDVVKDASNSSDPFTFPSGITSDVIGNYNANQGDLDGGDVVTFLTIVENQGNGTRGALDVWVELEIPKGLELEVDPNKWSFYRGTGEKFGGGTLPPISLATSLNDLENGTEPGYVIETNDGVDTVTIRFPDKTDTEGYLERQKTGDGEVDNGENIFAIQFQATPEYAHETYIVDSKITKFSATQGGHNLVEDDWTVGADADLLQDDAWIQTRQPKITKTASGLSFTIGEEVTYTVEIKLPEGLYPDLSIDDTLPNGFVYVADSATITESTWPGVSTTSTITGSGEVSFKIQGISDPVDPVDPDAVVPYHNNANDTDVETLVFTYQALVSDNPLNKDGETQENTVSLSWKRPNGDTRTHTDSSGVLIHEPELKVTKTLEGCSSDCLVIPGGTVTFKITVQNISEHTAYDITVTDDLTAFMDVWIDPGSVSVTAGSASYDSSSNTISATLASLEAQQSVTYEFQATIKDTATTGSSFVNTALLNYYSFNNDDARPYDTYDELTVNVISVTPTKTLVNATDNIDGKALDANPAVIFGEVLTYRLRAEIPQGTTKNFSITDSLPAGLTGTANDDWVRIYLEGDPTKVSHNTPSWPGFANAAPPATLTHSANITSTKKTIELSFGTIENLSGASAFIWVEFDVFVGDDTLDPLLHSDEIANSFTVGFARDEGGSGRTELDSPPVIVTVAEPNIVVEKKAEIVDSTDSDAVSADGNLSGVDRQEQVRYTIEVTNEDRAGTLITAPAYGIDLLDKIPAGMTYEPGSAEFVDEDGDPLSPQPAGFDVNVIDIGGTPTIEVSNVDNAARTKIEPGESLYLSYIVSVKDDVAAGIELTNTAYAGTWSYANDGAPGARGFTPTEGAMAPSPYMEPITFYTGDGSSTIKIAEPELSLSKQLLENPPSGGNADGTYDITFRIHVRNTGDRRLQNIQITDDLNAVFTGTTGIVVSEITSVTTGGDAGLSLLDPGPNNWLDYLSTTSNWQYLDTATSTLGAGKKAYIDIALRVTASHPDHLVTYENSASGTSETPGDGTDPNNPGFTDIDDVSNNGATPVHGDHEKTPVTLSEDGELTATKTATTPALVDPANGTYEVTFSIELENTGDVNLNNVGLTDDLDAMFAGKVNTTPGYEVVEGPNVTPTSSNLVANDDFDGSADKNLIVPSQSTLNKGESATVTFTVRFTPKDDTPTTRTFTNTVVPVGTTPANDAATGVNGEVDVTISVSPPIGISTWLISDDPTTGEPNGTYTVELGVRVKNYSDLDLTNVSAIFPVIDQIIATNPDVIVVLEEIEPTDGGADASTDYEGTGTGSNGEIFPSGTTIPANGERAFKITLSIIPGNVFDYEVHATASGKSPFISERASDESNNGGDPDDGDPDGGDPLHNKDGDPTNNTGPTPLNFPTNGVIEITKEVVSITPVTDTNGFATGEFTVVFSFHLKNTGASQLNDVQVEDNFEHVFGAGNVTVTDLRLDSTETTFAPLVVSFASLWDTVDPLALLHTGQSLLSPAQAHHGGNDHNQAAILVTVKVEPDDISEAKDYTNTAEATATAGSDDVQGTGETTFNFEQPKLTLAKEVTDSRLILGATEAAHTFEIDYKITVTNTSGPSFTGILQNIVVRDELRDNTFTAGQFTVKDIHTSDETKFPPNLSYNGGLDDVLVNDTGTEGLAGGESFTITFTVEVPFGEVETQVKRGAPTTLISTIDNTVTGEATSDSDISSKVPATPATANWLPEVANKVGVAKTASVFPQYDTDGEPTGLFNVRFTFVVKNLGESDIHNLSLDDSLNGFVNGLLDITETTSTTTFSKVDGTLIFNGAYDGDTVTELLGSGQTLSYNSSETLIVEITDLQLTAGFDPVAENTATAAGEPTLGDLTPADSSDGVDPEGPVSPTPIPLVSPIFTKSIIDSSDSNTTDPYVAIGEQITYRLVAEVPFGISTNVRIVDELPAHLEFDTAYGVYGYINVSSTHALAKDGGPTIQFGTTPAAVDHSVSGQTITVEIADELNLSGPIADASTIVLEFRATVKGNTGLESGDTFTNTFTFERDNTPPVPSNKKTSTVAEPAIIATKTVTEVNNTQANVAGGHATNVDLDDIVTFTVTAENTGTGPGYGAIITDTIPAGFDFVALDSVTNGGDDVTTHFATSGTVVFTAVPDLVLLPGETYTIVYRAKVNADTDNAPGATLENSVVVSVSSTPDAPTDPANPDDRITSSDPVSATVTLAEPKAEIIKTAAITAYDGANTFSLRYGFTVENTGPITLNRVEITDDLATLFVQADVSNIDVAAPSGWTATPTGYDGYAQTVVYDGIIPVLAPSATSDELVVTFDITLSNDADLKDYMNTAQLIARTPGGTGLPSDEDDDSATVNLREWYEPAVGITKEVVDDWNNGDGTYGVTYEIIVSNTSTSDKGVDLVNPQVTEDLSATFPLPTTFEVLSATAVHSDTTVGSLNAYLADIDDFGSTATQLFDFGSDDVVLKRPAIGATVGDSITITFTVEYTPPVQTDLTYNNTASVSADSPFEGGDPIEKDTPDVPLNYAEAPIIGVSTSHTDTEDFGDGSYVVELTIDLKNYGNTEDDGVQLDNISVPFKLADYFQGAAFFELMTGSDAPSSTYLTLNPAYDGVNNTELLDPNATNILYTQDQSGTSESTITLKVLVVPGNTLKYEVETTVSAKTPLDYPVSDDSNDGGDPDNGGAVDADGDPIGTDPDDPDLDENGDGDPTNNTSPTIITFADAPAIGVAKRFVDTTFEATGAPGEFKLQFDFVIENHGKSQLNSVELLEDFTDLFGDTSTWSIQSITAEAPLVAASPAPSQTTGFVNLLDSASKLGTAAQAGLTGTAQLANVAKVSVVLHVVPDDPSAEHFNTAYAAGTSPASNRVESPSYDGITPWDPADLDAPENEQDPDEPGNPTPFHFERPDIAVTKEATSSIRPDGQMDLHYTFTIQNTGDVDLHNVRLTDNLADALGAGNYTLMSLYSTTLTVQALAPVSGGYDGHTNIDLLTGTDTIHTGEWYAEPIKAGAEHTVHLHVVVKDPDAEGATNTAYAYGTSPAQNIVDDKDDHTVFPDENPQIALAKSATVDLQSDGTFNVDYRFVVKNVGDVQLSNVQITEDFQDLYASTDLTAADISRVYSELTYNTSFTGNTDPNLLTGVDTLEIGQEKTIIIRLSGITANHAGDIRNSALATGEGPYGGKTNDRSNDGLTPEPGEDVPTKINLTPTTQIAIAKHSASELRTDGTYDVTFTLNVANVGNSKLLGVQVRDTLEDFYAKTDLTASKISVSSSDFAVNSTFDGANDPDLLLGTDTLAVGASGVITIKLAQLTPNTGVTAVENTAVATGRDATGERTTDKSNDGVTPEPGNDTPTITPLSPQPQIGIAKRASVSLKADGTYTAVFDLVLKNYGNTVIHNVQVTDDLAEFYSDAGLSAANISVSATGLSVNSSYNGQSDQNLLTGTDTLGLTETKTITITLTGLVVTPPKTIFNTAIAKGTDPSGTVPTEDRSTDGDDPDPDGNEDPTDNDDPTPVDFDENPVLGLAKDATVEPGSATGSFKITFEILVKNYGNTDLVDLQVTDDMAASLLDLADSYDAPVVTSPDFSVNDMGTTAYDGDNFTDLLTGTDVLPVGGEGIIIIVIDNFVPSPAYSRGENSATGEGTPPTKPGDEPKDPVKDTSQNGKDPDPDNDGDPTNNNDPTPVDFTVDPPVVGIAKAAEVTEHSDGTFDVTLLFTVKNYSKEDADNIQIRDDLTDLYAQTTVDASAITVSSSDFTVNASFDGFTDVHVLAGTDTLAAGASGTATVFIEGIRATGDKVEVFNTAIVTGTDPRTGRPITPDESTNGEDPDPDGDGDPHNNNEPTPILVHVAPKIGLAKAATVDAKGDGVHDITFTIRAVNYGDTELSNLSITDSLAEFYSRTNLTPAQVSVSSTTFTTNPLYDGQTDTEILGSGNSLKVGGEGTVSITLAGVIPASDVTRLYNSAFTTAEAPGGRTVDDTSHNGNDPDPSGTNNPGDYNDPTPVDFTPVGSVLLEKQAEKGNYEIGDKITYTITVSNPHDVAISFTLLDTIPTHTTYITDSTVFNDDALVPLDGKEPRQKDFDTLEWRSILLPAGKVLTITYDLRILPGADGDLTNVVTIDGEDENNKRFTDRTTETVKVSQGIFDREKSTLIGRVFIDVNNNSIYDEGIDIPVENARVILANGWQTTTDAQGNYAFRNIDTGTWSVQLDERTAPYPTQRHPEQLRDKYQHRVSVSGLTVSDFPLIGVIGDIETDRETFVTFGPLTLHKYIVTGDEADTAVLTISTTEDLPAAILVTDPQPDGTTTTYVVEPSAGAASTITYDLPLGSQLTDPILEWSDQ